MSEWKSMMDSLTEETLPELPLAVTVCAIRDRASRPVKIPYFRSISASSGIGGSESPISHFEGDSPSSIKPICQLTKSIDSGIQMAVKPPKLKEVSVTTSSSGVMADSPRSIKPICQLTKSIDSGIQMSVKQPKLKAVSVTTLSGVMARTVGSGRRSIGVGRTGAPQHGGGGQTNITGTSWTQSGSKPWFPCMSADTRDNLLILVGLLSLPLCQGFAAVSLYYSIRGRRARRQGRLVQAKEMRGAAYQILTLGLVWLLAFIFMICVMYGLSLLYDGQGQVSSSQRDHVSVSRPATTTTPQPTPAAQPLPVPERDRIDSRDKQDHFNMFLAVSKPMETSHLERTDVNRGEIVADEEQHALPDPMFHHDGIYYGSGSNGGKEDPK